MAFASDAADRIANPPTDDARDQGSVFDGTSTLAKTRDAFTWTTGRPPTTGPASRHDTGRGPRWWASPAPVAG